MSGSLGEFNAAGPFETRNFVDGEFVKSSSGKTFETVNPATEEVIASVEDSNATDVDAAVAAARRAFSDGSEWKTIFETRNFVDGEFVKSSSGKTFETVNPATEEVIASVEDSNATDVDAAVAAARRAFADGSEWKTMNASGRRDLMLKLANAIESNKEYLSKLESLDNGKPWKNGAYSAQIDLHLVIQCYRYYAGWADKLQGKHIPVDGEMMCYTRHEPVGVVGQIIPWNFPLLMQAWKLGPALATGCTVVMKTSEKTPLSALAICRLIQEVGFPKGVVNIVSGFGPTAGSPIALHMDVDKIAFTGSSPVGHKIMEMAAQSNLKRVSLELGGKSPLIVLPDADLEQAVSAAHIGLFLNMGQCCCASSRVFVHDDIYDKFVAASAAKAKEWKAGPQFEESSLHGAQVDKIQFDKVMGYIEKGKSEGAKCVAGGERHGSTGFFVQPTVFSEVTDEMTIAKEEIFGPVSSIIRFTDVKDAIRRANNSKYGLAAGICTRDIGTAVKMAGELQAGTIWINCYNNFDMAAPFGGFKSSGIGRELGEYGLANYTETKTVYIPMDGKY
eukprot:CAMPEP_0204303510 /NCGR_PEP_ID=MMETSP0468-20130131/83942_1 /ASSEMBLY_ACC=CAM_ASM_000383 /TAXON_ID=2969 /ORGANISM="Oxyrrhis marina" /LENGTH=560 /DNA_ID=CAMNT_0051282823 /DNA_START=145 /DNA_END=1827 /DNA_ORIENTATION=-